MYDTTRELIEALRATPDTLAALLHDLSPQQAQTARGGDENWSIIEVVCHLRDNEAFAIQRMQTLRDATEPIITGFDQEAWAAERDYATADLHDALAAFLALRQKHLAQLESLTPGQWQRTGRHAALGPVTLLNHTQHILWHDSIHLAQIGRQQGQPR